MSETKKYAGIGKKVSTQYGELTKVAYRRDDINTMVQWLKDNPDETFVTLNLKEKREPKNSWTLYGEIDEFKPEPQPTNATAEDDTDDLPF